jgi:beta-lactamase regulating signal transducer with metallopeptidase domain
MPNLALECAVRAALIAMGTAAALRLLRVGSAAARHAAWAGVVILMMLLPVWTAWGPKAFWRVLPAIAPPASGSRAMLHVVAVSEPPLPGVQTIPALPQAPGPAWWTILASVYAFGVCVLLARLVIGTARARRLVRRAADSGGRLTSDACAAPVTVGWLTPTIILPAGWQRWPQAQLDAVLAHEGEHARRRDPLVQSLALLNRAIFWFHPLAWWLERRLSALAEEACDDAVLARGCDPFTYSEYLLEMARSVVRAGARVKILGMAMPGSCLPRRIRQILEGRPAQRISRLRMVFLAVACVLTSAVFATGAVGRRMAERQMLPPTIATRKLPAPGPLDLAPAPPARRVLAAQAQAAPRKPAPPQAVAAAKPEERYKDKRLLVLYFDLQAMPAPDRQRAFGFAQHFVRTEMQASDLVAIMTANDDVKVMQDFTADRDQLQRTLDQLTATSGPGRGAAADADRQLTNLHTAVNMLRSMPGKKAVVYFATAVERAGSAERQSLIDAAIRANVAFYAIDPRGLSSAYIIRAQDVLEISVVRQEGISGEYQVRPDGVISLPLAGNVTAAGLTVAQLEAVIADRLEANGILDQPSVTVEVRQRQNP